MKYCPVIPPKVMPLFYENRVKIPENMGWFCYANVAAEDEQYAAFFRDQEYVVLDCPIVEKGRILNPRELRSLVAYIKPTFTIIPDVVFDRSKTLRWFWDYCQHIDDKSMCGVLQGRTAQDLVQCARYMYGYGVSRLAIPRISHNNGGVPRSELLKMMQGVVPDSVQWHMLGASYPYADEYKVANFAQSCDSAEAVNAAYYRDYLGRETTKRPSNFMDLTDAQLDVTWLERNIDTIAGWFEHGLDS